jgi:pimeloyl-ACP methyl ester carboxylesterase
MRKFSAFQTYLAFHVSLSIILQANAGPTTGPGSVASMVYSFSNLTASTDINWVPCFDNYSCTLLEVPLDYANTSIGTTSIAFLKLPAANQPSHDLLVNFGGPGGSGVGSVMFFAEDLAQTYGPDVNIIGFDPRGVNNSGPSLDCFPGDPIARNNFNTRYYNTISDSSSNSINEQYYWGKALAQWCSERIGGPSGTARYANTPAVANDLITFTESQARAAGQPAGDAKVWYYGYSYGTVLGFTLASLFPDRVGRLVLDGVVQPWEYYAGAWNHDLLQADEAVQSFFYFCNQAGKDLCAFYENTTQAIADRFESVLANLRQHPLPVVDDPLVAEPTLATYAILKHVLLGALYTPLTDFPTLAELLVDIENGNGTSLLLAAGTVQNDNPSLQNMGPDTSNPGIVIGCVDGYGREGATILSSLDSYSAYVAKLRNQSKYVGDAWGSNVFSCNNMDVEPPPSGRFSGKFAELDFNNHSLTGRACFR